MASRGYDGIEAVLRRVRKTKVPAAEAVSLLLPYLRGDSNESDWAIGALVELAETSDAALAALVDQLSDPVNEQKIVYGLSRIKREASPIVEAFVAALDSRNGYVREAALEFFAEHLQHASKAEKQIRSLLKDKASRSKALKLLGVMGADLEATEDSQRTKTTRSFMAMWLYGGLPGRFYCLWPVRMAINILLLIGATYLGAWIGYPGLGAGVGLVAVFVWIGLSADFSLVTAAGLIVGAILCK